MMPIADFLSTAGRRRFSWGTHDCMLFAADWARAVSGKDPAAAWRGTYSTCDGAAAVIAAAGGALALMDDALRRAGWRAVDVPAPGDVILACPPGHTEPVAAIVVRLSMAASVTARGLALWPPQDVIQAWRPAHG